MQMSNKESIPKQIGSSVQLDSRGSKSRLPLQAFAFSLQYAFYHMYFRDFPGGPIGTAVRNAGASVETVSVFIMISLALGVACCFYNVWMQMVYKRRNLKVFLLVSAFLSAMLMPLASHTWLIIVFAVIGAFCAGTLMCRSLYTAMFLSMGIHPSLIVVVVYAIFQPIYTIFQLLPVLRTLPMYYAVGAPLLFVGLAFFFPHDGDEMERRRILPENKLRLTAIWPPLAFIVLSEISFAFYEVILLPEMTGQPIDQIIRIIPNAVVLLVFAFFGRKISVRGALTAFAVVSACAALAFLTNISKAAVYMFTEPAYRFNNLFFFWLLLSSFRMYGRNQSRLKIFIAVYVALGVIVIMLTQLLLPMLPAGSFSAITLFVIVVGVFLLLPKVEQTISNMDAQGEYAENREERNVPLPNQRDDILAARDALEHTLPSGVTLTTEEETVLAYLIDSQPTDVTAHFMDTTINKINAWTNTINAKFGCKNKNELMTKLGAAQAEIVFREQMRGLIATDSLTQKEKDIALLLIDGEAKRDIARKLHMDAAELKLHEDAIRHKLDLLSNLDPVIVSVVEKYALTKREAEILSYLYKNMTNDEIAAELYLSEHTVKGHVQNLIKKLPVEKRSTIPVWLDSERSRIIKNNIAQF